MARLVNRCVFIFLIIVTYWSLVTDSDNTDENIEKICLGMNKQCLMNHYKDFPLPRRDPVKVWLKEVTAFYVVIGLKKH